VEKIREKTIEKFLVRDEGKTLEFKENCRPLDRIVRTAVAFANTAGGAIVIGVKDKTKEVVGLADPLVEEERLANVFADGIRPFLVPDVQICAWRKRQLIVVTVPHAIGPYYVCSEGAESGAYVRLGSTNRPAGPELLAEIRRLARNTFFDEQPCSETNSEDIDFRVASELFAEVSKSLTPPKRRSLGLVVGQGVREVPSIGAVLLFGKTRGRLFPSATIRCARFLGTNTAKFLDQVEIDTHLPKAVNSAVAFIERNTRQGIEIGRIRRRNVPEYPVEAVREAVINALVHADYGIGGAATKISVFDNRIEITNPGFLPFGLTLEAALAGVSRLRNRVIGRTFRELELIEQWGSGLGRITDACAKVGLPAPRFEELGTNFRITLFGERVAVSARPDWQAGLLEHLAKESRISTLTAAKLWKTSDRTARTRLRRLVNEGLLAEVGSGPKDPYRTYVLKGR
jgi:predicted HTH transcriptional regulator